MLKLDLIRLQSHTGSIQFTPYAEEGPPLSQLRRAETFVRRYEIETGSGAEKLSGVVPIGR